MGFLRKNPEGTHLGQINDAYPSVAADIAHLQKEVRPVASQRMACLIHGMGRCAMHILCAIPVCLLQHAKNEWAVDECYALVGRITQCKATCHVRDTLHALCRERCGACKAQRQGSLCCTRASNRPSSESQPMWLPCGMR